jgi:GTP cyclohydrolase I
MAKVTVDPCSPSIDITKTPFLKESYSMTGTSNPFIPASQRIRNRIEKAGARFWANDNISQFIQDDNERWELIDELEKKFADVMDTMLIDTATDPNSNGTPRRLAKMYVNELMSGRYFAPPTVTSFPNDSEKRYGGIIVVRSEFLSQCSHHWQPVKGVAYIGILPSNKVIGLSKYTRIVQHIARVGTLQEQLTVDIADEIQKYTDTRDVAVYVEAEHGCCINRGIMAKNSQTQTCELRGQFFNPSVKQEFLSYIQMQQAHANR